MKKAQNGKGDIDEQAEFEIRVENGLGYAPSVFHPT